jgi:integrase
MDDVADSTLMGYESLYNSYWNAFDERNIHTLHLVELQDHLSQKKVKKKTKREALNLLKRIFAVAGANTLDEWIIKKTKRDANPEPDPYTAEERDALLSALYDMGRARVEDMIAYRYFYTGFYTGMRTGELLGVHWSDFHGSYFHVWQSMVRRKMQKHTKTKRRDVLLTDGIIALLKDTHNPTRLKRENIFLTPEGHIFKDADWLMERWSRAHKKAKIRKRGGLYPWRHTYISLALSQGIPIVPIAVQVGNSPAIIQKHYFKWMPTKDDSELLRKQLQEAVK